ncbi:hypothetical protein NQ315_013992 [Exocentrus adspersus]|uniref:Uncharacterized protein n=1 Tax=Exocentrus adspersus TaxID=1586481 RepID=A0AAV8VHN2_9CUCU|nr:hypothetical protein NQ315_013992 [Exocentrus adspersus]
MKTKANELKWAYTMRFTGRLAGSENNEEIAQLVSEAESSLLPVKSRAKYEKSYQQFCHWRNEKDVRGASEGILIAYFCEKVKILKASTLWSLYSMVRSTLQINENVDISAYKKLLAYLKLFFLSMENVKNFLKKAADADFLFMKVVMIIALHGACQAEELRLLKVDDDII